MEAMIQKKMVGRGDVSVISAQACVILDLPQVRGRKPFGKFMYEPTVSNFSCIMQEFTT
jgi:hypothetical protein